jgi:hypothetical protein
MSKCYQIHIRNRHPSKGNYCEHIYLLVLNDDDIEPEVTISEGEASFKHVGEYKTIKTEPKPL